MADPATGWDTAQEAMVRTWTHWGGVSNPDAYCYLVAVNLVRRQWRQRSRARQVEHQMASDASGAAQAGMSREECQAVRDMVCRLPRRLQLPTLLHYWADLPSVQIAELLGKPEGTIRRRLWQARALLAAQVKELAHV